MRRPQTPGASELTPHAVASQAKKMKIDTYTLARGVSAAISMYLTMLRQAERLVNVETRLAEVRHQADNMLADRQYRPTPTRLATREDHTLIESDRVTEDFGGQLMSGGPESLKPALCFDVASEELAI